MRERLGEKWVVRKIRECKVSFCVNKRRHIYYLFSCHAAVANHHPDLADRPTATGRELLPLYFHKINSKIYGQGI